MEINLSSQLKKLNIDLSGLEENSISAWNNKHMPDTVAFFDWFTRYLSESNVLEPSESEEYSFLAGNNLLHDYEYDIALADIERAHPGIFDIGLNKSQLYIRESEYETLKEYERKLESEIEVNMGKSKQIEKQLRAAKNKKDMLSIDCENSYEICISESKRVDDTFCELRFKVLDCLECWNKNWSIFYTGDEKLIQKYKDGFTNVSRFCDTFCLNSLTFELDHSNDTELETLRKRLYEAILYSSIAQVKEKQLEAELTFYKDFDSMEGALISTEEDQWCLIQAEALEVSKKISTDKSLELLQVLILEYVRNHVNNLNIIKLKKTILETRKKYENVFKIENIVMDIVACNITHLNLVKLIDEKVQAMDAFLRVELLDIVNSDLRTCINRTEFMKQRIQEQEEDQLNSIEKQNKLLRIIVDLISNKPIDEITPEVFKNVVNKFYGTILDYERKLFISDIEIYRSKVNVLERNNYFIKEHLKSQSTNEIIMCPLDYSSALREIRMTSKEAEHLIAKVIQHRKSADETLKGNKWLRIRRQLWMYFLVNPRKLVEYLNEITKENNMKILNQMDDNKIIHNAHKYMNN